jgi:protein disulfide-isomerase A5
METRVVHLDSETFKTSLKKKRHALVLFYSPWNEEFQTLRTQYTAAAEKFADDSRIVLAAVDCSTNIELCKEQKLTRLPITYYFSYLKEREALTEPWTKDSLVAFISKKEKAGQLEDEKEEKKKVENAGGFDFHENVATGTSENFAGLIETGRKLVMFYAPCMKCT